MNNPKIFQQLSDLYQQTEPIEIGLKDKILILSDVHKGNGGFADEFLPNSKLYKKILKDHYLPNDFRLVLNGDIEELYKFRFKQIHDYWQDVYKIYDEFVDNGHFYKIIGNHDYDLIHDGFGKSNENLTFAVKFQFEGKDIFIFHGHQTSNYLQTYNKLSLYFVRYFVNPLRISNSTFTLDTKKIFITELRNYRFSSLKKIISIIGHTHKPLFESMSKKDSLTYQIENMIRKYPKSKAKKKRKIQKKIDKFKKEFQSLQANNDKRETLRHALYNDDLLVPCLFNSGSVIGKRGLTGIEIENGMIRLVYWFDRNKSQRYLNFKGISTEQLGNTDFFRAVLKEESLNYIASRINLLS